MMGETMRAPVALTSASSTHDASLARLERKLDWLIRQKVVAEFSTRDLGVIPAEMIQRHVAETLAGLAEELR